MCFVAVIILLSGEEIRNENPCPQNSILTKWINVYRKYLLIFMNIIIWKKSFHYYLLPFIISEWTHFSDALLWFLQIEFKVTGQLIGLKSVI